MTEIFKKFLGALGYCVKAISAFVRVAETHNITTPPQRYLWRAVRDEEEQDDGVYAKNPASATALAVAVRNGSNIQTQFIPTTADFCVARKNALEDRVRVIKIDTEKLPQGTLFFDVSTRKKAMELFSAYGEVRGKKESYFELAANYAVASTEVDLAGYIPADAIVDIMSVEDLLLSAEIHVSSSAACAAYRAAAKAIGLVEGACVRSADGSVGVIRSLSLEYGQFYIGWSRGEGKKTRYIHYYMKDLFEVGSFNVKDGKLPWEFCDAQQ